MSREAEKRSGVGAHVVDGVLIVPAPADFSDDSLVALKKDVLVAVHASSLRHVVIDVSRIELLDPVMFGILTDTARTAGLLGARTVFVGFQPGVVSALIDMDVPCDDIVSASSLEDGLRLVRSCQENPADPAEREEREANPEEAAGENQGSACDEERS